MENGIMYSDEDREVLMKYSWYISSSGYAVATIKGKKVLMHRFITKCEKGLEVDHINGNKIDNRRDNLRICTRQQNEVNKPPSKNNKTGYRGVVLQRNGKYKAQTYWMKKNIHIGYFKTIQEAVEAYKIKTKELFGDFSRS